jgi:hypothetical protein
MIAEKTINGDTYDAVSQALRQPFDTRQVEWRVSQVGLSAAGPWARVLSYVDARAVTDRLDECCGVNGWEMSPPQPLVDAGKLAGFIVGVGLRFFSDEGGIKTIWRYDVSALSNFEAVKGGYSGALRRAAALWGVGKYLYLLPEAFAQTSLQKPGRDAVGWHYQPASENRRGAVPAFYWQEPTLPEWATPAGSGTPPQAAFRAPIAGPALAQPHLDSAHLDSAHLDSAHLDSAHLDSTRKKAAQAATPAYTANAAHQSDFGAQSHSGLAGASGAGYGGQPDNRPPMQVCPYCSEVRAIPSKYRPGQWYCMACKAKIPGDQMQHAVAAASVEPAPQTRYPGDGSGGSVVEPAPALGDDIPW